MERKETENKETSHRPANRSTNRPANARPQSRRPSSRTNSRSTGNRSTGNRGNHTNNQRRDSQPSSNSRQVRKPAQRMIRNRRPVRPKKSIDVIPEINSGVIRVIPLGGVEEVGKNMTAIEIGQDIIIVDIGFQFKDETTPGIDYIIPNTRYLEDKKDKIKGIFITHGHLDHIGGIPYVIEKIGNPPIYTRQFGAIMIQKRHEEFPHLPKLDVKILDGDETVPIGETMKVETFAISHTIPDSMGLVIHTAFGDIVFVEDVRVDNINGIPTDEEVNQYKRFKGKEYLMLTMDSTSVEKPGWSLSENVVVENIEKIIKETNGRLIIGTFASQVERILAIIRLSDTYGKKVVIEGRSMKSNVEIIKYLKLTDAENLIPLSEIDNYPPDKIVMLVTGAQGEEFAALGRMANKTHKFITLRPEDTILLSSSIIPTNHAAIVRLKDKLYRSNAKIITYLDSDVHASGHGNREELKWIHEQVNYRFFMPVHGNHFMLRQHAELSKSLGTPEENVVVPDNGSIIEISDGGKKIEKLAVRAPHDVVTVDGFAVSDIQDVVLHDRQLLSEAGIFVIVATINTKTGKLKKSPDIISRGFVYLRESQDLLRKSRTIVKRVIEKRTEKMRPIDFEILKKEVADEMTKFLYQQTAKQPLVIPVLLGMM